MAALIVQEVSADAVALERERAGEARAAELDRINSLLMRNSEALARARTPQEIFESFLLHAVSAMQGCGGGLLRRVSGSEHEFVALAQDNELVPRQSWADLAIVLESPEVTRGDAKGVIARVMRGEEVWLDVDDELAKWAPEAAEYHRQNGNHRLVLWPFHISGEVGGYIGIAFASETPPSQPQRETLKALSSQASLAVELNAMTTKVEQAAIAKERQNAAEARVVELARTNAALKQTLDVVAFESDLDKVLGQVLTAITSQLNSGSSALWLKDRENGRFGVHIVYCAGEVMTLAEHNESQAKGVWGLGRNLLLKAHMKQRKPIAYQVSDLERLHPAVHAFFQKHGIQTLLGIPLLLGPDISGTLTVRFEELRVFSSEELALAQAVAHQATMAIQLTDLAKCAGQAALTEERNRLAREIHDTLAQGFTGILMQVGAMSQIPDATAESMKPYMDSIQKLAQSSLIEARRSVGALRPSLPRDSFTEAVAETVERIRLQTRAQIQFEIRGAPIRIEAIAEDELLRIAGESLVNAVKHADASMIAVWLDFEPDSIRLAIQDDGVGFSNERQTYRGSYGLIGMQERAARIGANLTVISDIGHGTKVVVRWTNPKV